MKKGKDSNMKKILFLVNMAIVSSSVFGMNPNEFQQDGRFSRGYQNISSSSDAVAQNQTDFSLSLNERDMFNKIKEEVLNSEFISENAKTLFEVLNFDEFEYINKEDNKACQLVRQNIDNYIKNQVKEHKQEIQNDFSESLENSFKYKFYSGRPFQDNHWDTLHQIAAHNLGKFIIEKNAKQVAKSFFKQVLGNSKLGEALKAQVEEVIDKAHCYKITKLKDLFQSRSLFAPKDIYCYYLTYDSLFFILVHETAHCLDYLYQNGRIINEKKQLENVSIFFLVSVLFLFLDFLNFI